MSIIFYAGKASLKTENDGPQIAITFVNNTSSVLSYYWLNRDGEAVPYGTLLPGERKKKSK